ncbi:adenosine deaminase family protein [bacterium]|nr:adenosine deaminase family protein [bacterium]
MEIVKPDKAIEELIRKIPKTDLHCHLDGSIRLETIIDLAKSENITLPSYTVDGLNNLLFKEQYNSLVEYLNTFAYSCRVMQIPESLERISYELAVDAQKEGVRYLEVRFAPQLHINKHMDMKAVLEAVNNGLYKAQHEFNKRTIIQNSQEPAFCYGIIACALRSFGAISEYYTNFINALPYSEPKQIYSLGSLELAKGASKIRNEQGLPIVAFDLAGAEAGNPAKDHWQAFQYAHEQFMAKTVHAGEAYGAPSIFQAITELHADRIGHGYYLFDVSKIDAGIINKQAYIDALVEYIAQKRVTIEVCLTSNLQTNPSIVDLSSHSFKHMLDAGLSTTFCTDNRTVSKTTVTREIMLALKHFDIDPKKLKNAIIYGFKRSFYPGNYLEKRQYVRTCIEFYERLTAGTQLDCT